MEGGEKRVKKLGRSAEWRGEARGGAGPRPPAGGRSAAAGGGSAALRGGRAGIAAEPRTREAAAAAAARRGRLGPRPPWPRVRRGTRRRALAGGGRRGRLRGASLPEPARRRGNVWIVSYFRTLFSGPIILTFGRNTSEEH